MTRTDGAELVDERWQQLAWLICERASTKMLRAIFRDYWYGLYHMMRKPLHALHVNFAAQLGDRILD